MGWLTYTLAVVVLILPWSIGLALLIRHREAGWLPMVLGYGAVLGLLIIPLIMRVQSALGWGLGFSEPLVISCLFPLAVYFRSRGLSATASTTDNLSNRTSGYCNWAKLVQNLCLCLIVLRFFNVLGEVLLQPLFPWDATMHWATKAKVWFLKGDILPFVENRLWLKDQTPLVYTDRHPDYPSTVPLLQVWMNLSLGRWDSSLMNAPWIICYTAIGLIFYGQLRYAGTTRTLALAGSYMLLSLPVLNSHVMLAGYADIFVSTCYLGAITAFYNWSVKRESWQGAMAVIMAFACLLVKNEGLFWLASFLPGLLLVVLSGLWGWFINIGLVAAALIILMVFPRDLSIAGHTMEQLRLEFKFEAIAPILENLLVFDNWHLLIFGLVVVVPTSLVLSAEARRRVTPALVTVLAALAMYLFLFTSTRYVYGAINSTAVNRIGLHLIPALAFVGLLSWLHLEKRSRNSAD